jgi:predicted transcriptional regulator
MSPLANDNPDPCFKLIPHGLRFDSKPSFEEWMAVGNVLMQAGRSNSFQLGDWLNYGKAMWGEKYTEGMVLTDRAYKTLANYAYIASNVSQSIREPSLGHEHHAAVAMLDPLEQKKWLDIAVRHDLSVVRLRMSIKLDRIVSTEEAKRKSAHRRQVTYLAMIDDLFRLWRKENKQLPVAKWDVNRRRALKRDFGRLKEIFDALD